MYYTNKETFILSSVGCMDTEPDGLESILAGNEEGAKGCCLSVDMTADGIAVLSSDGYCVAADGTQMSIADFSYTELHQVAPQLIPAGQAIELARTCQAKIAITVHNQTLLPQLRMTLRHVNYLDDTIFVGLVWWRQRASRWPIRICTSWESCPRCRIISTRWCRRRKRPVCSASVRLPGI